MILIVCGVLVIIVLIEILVKVVKDNDLPTNEEEWSDDVKAGDFE